MVVFRFWDRTWEAFGNWKFFFLKILLSRIVFWGEIYRELPCRRNYYIIISGSLSKVGKTMKKSFFSSFVREHEIMLESMQHHGNLQWILPQKILWSVFFPEKKKISSDIPKWSFSDFEKEPETPFRNRNFFFLKFNLLV